MIAPTVTVLMPLYNGERFLRTAIHSVLTQDFNDFELMIVDDGSTDGTLDIVRSYQDARIRLLQNPRNLGIVSAMQAGLHAALGKYVARLDADDICLPGRLGLQVEYMRSHPETAVLGGAGDVIDGNGVVVGRYRGPTVSVLIEWELLFRNPIIHSSVMYRRAEILRMGGYRTGFPHAEDYDMWSRISGARRDSLAQLETPVVQLRKHTGQISTTYGTMMTATTDRIAKANIERTLGYGVDAAAVSCLCGHLDVPISSATIESAYRVLGECWECFRKSRLDGRAQERSLVRTSLPLFLMLVRQDRASRWRAFRWIARHVLLRTPECVGAPWFLAFCAHVALRRSAAHIQELIARAGPMVGASPDVDRTR